MLAYQLFCFKDKRLENKTIKMELESIYELTVLNIYCDISQKLPAVMSSPMPEGTDNLHKVTSLKILIRSLV